MRVGVESRGKGVVSAELYPHERFEIMEITGIETLVTDHPLMPHSGRNRLMWVRITTNTGLTGLGETFPDGFPEAAFIHGSLARILLGRNPLDIETLWWDMFSSFEYYGWAGAEIRALSAVDMALWDIAGRSAGVPLYRLLGGKSRELPVYNTCYDREFSMQTQAADLAELLLKQNVTMMKLWPFDRFASRDKGQSITEEELRQATIPLRDIRERVGDEMRIAIEGHGYWNLSSAVRIAVAVEPFGITWLEDLLPLPQSNVEAYRELARSTSIPLCLSERLMTRWQYNPFLDHRSAQIIMLDVAWTGGISEARRICAMAEAHQLPVTFHNCGGPVLCSATTHLAAATQNLLNVETVRPYFDDYLVYSRGCPEIQKGFLCPTEAPGLGIQLCDEMGLSERVRVQRSGQAVPGLPT